MNFEGFLTEKKSICHLLSYNVNKSHVSKNTKNYNFSLKMGRKIPGKKHHGVKDPEKQKEKRESELRLKVSLNEKNQ